MVLDKNSRDLHTFGVFGFCIFITKIFENSPGGAWGLLSSNPYLPHSPVCIYEAIILQPGQKAKEKVRGQNKSQDLFLNGDK